MKQGFDVTGVDTGYYRAGWLYNPAGISVKTLNKDLREIASDDLRGHRGGRTHGRAVE